MKQIVYDLKTKKTEIVEIQDTVIEEIETPPITILPTAEERIEALEMAMLEMLEVMANG